MNKRLGRMSFLCLLMMLLMPASMSAKTYKGTINIVVGQEYYVSHGYESNAYTVSGYWTKTDGNAFVITGSSSSNGGCTIKGNQVGTSTLNWTGYVYAGGSGWDVEYYWTITVSDHYELPPLSANPPGGQVEKGTIVKLYANGKGAEWSYDFLHYTLNGDDPYDYIGNRYSYEGIPIEENCTLKAVGYKWNGNDYDCSEELVETYTIVVPELTLSASPYGIGKTYDVGTVVYLSTPNVSGAEIYYTTDGIDPSKNSQKYSSSGITINQSCIIKAIAYKEGYKDSGIKQWYYAINQDDIIIDATNFPDENFRNYLLNRDYGKDGTISSKDIRNNVEMSPSNKSIKDFKGIESFTLLQTLYCSVNSLSSLDLSGNKYLEGLYCQYNWNLSSINLLNNVALKGLNCMSCGLTSLDVSNNSELLGLRCDWNQLSSLDVSNHSKLVTLNCEKNHLEYLNVSNCTALTELNCSKNQLKDSAMDALINGLPQNTSSEVFHFRVIGSTGSGEGNVCTKKQVAALKAKGWLPECYDGTNWVEYAGSEEIVYITDIDLNKTSLTLLSGQEEKLTATVKPNNATNKTVTWSSSNHYVATVSSDGTVTAVAAGNAVITCMANDGSGVTATCDVTVTDPDPDPIGIAISPTSKTIEQGETFTATYTLTPSNATTKVTWSSDNESIATVTQNGIVTGVGVGSTFINVETANGKSAYCKLTVTNPQPIEVSIPKSATVNVGETITLTATLTPANAVTTLTWQIDDPAIATVDANGKVTGIAEGLAIIKVSTANGLTSNACKLTVNPPSGIEDVTIEKLTPSVFSLSGQRLAAPRKGINIIGGKKVVIK
ncbi:MAG: Ig-like domain-containing protein [Prevotella sp.]|nr:Ig-like domain-containing protein [Prevotella sp.]